MSSLHPTKHHPLRLSLFLLLLFSISPLAYSAPTKGSVEKQHPAPHNIKHLLMKDALLQALKKHSMTSVASAQSDVGTAYHSQADALFAGDPSYNITYRSDQVDSNQGYREFEGSLDFPIWTSGQKSVRHKLGSRIISRVKAEQSLLKWEISGEVLERAWALRIAQMEVEQARVQQQSAKNIEIDVERRVQAGEIARGDLLLAQQSTGQAKLMVQNAEAEVAKARTSWQAYTGFTQVPADLLKQSQVKKSAHSQHPH